MVSSRDTIGSIIRQVGVVLVVMLGVDPLLEAAEIRREIISMGTRLTVAVRADRTEVAWHAAESAFRAVDEVETRLSTWRDDSEVSRVNRSEAGRWVEVSAETAVDLQEAQRWALLTGGTFSPGVGEGVRRWRSWADGAIEERIKPKDWLLGAAPENLEIRGNRVRRIHALYRIDLGAFGKGAALRKAAEAALRSGADCIDLNFGGQLMRAGSCGVTKIAIASPQDRSSVFALHSWGTGSIATSGNSERGMTKGGSAVGHILDPRTGEPSSFGGSVTVLADDPVAADCLSTALFVMGPEEGLDWLAIHPGLSIDALWIAGDGKAMWATSGFQEKLTIKETSDSRHALQGCRVIGGKNGSTSVH